MVDSLTECHLVLTDKPRLHKIPGWQNKCVSYMGLFMHGTSGPILQSGYIKISDLGPIVSKYIGSTVNLHIGLDKSELA